MINRDGSVDPEFTRYWSIGWDGPGSRQRTEDARLVIARWRFSPGVRSDTAVRVALGLELFAPAAPDTQPSTLTWKYVQGLERDSLVGTWSLLPSLPAFNANVVLDATANALRALLESDPHELSPGFCLRRADLRGPLIADLIERTASGDGNRDRRLAECAGDRRGIELHIGRTWRPAPNIATVELAIINEQRRRGLHYRCLVGVDTAMVECGNPSMSIWVY